VDEIDPAPLLPTSRRRCSPSSSPLPPLLPPQPRDGWRPRSLGDDSRREGEDSPAPLCPGGGKVVAEVVAEPRLQLVLLVELPSCRCRGECCRVKLAGRSAFRPGDVNIRHRALGLRHAVLSFWSLPRTPAAACPNIFLAKVAAFSIPLVYLDRRGLDRTNQWTPAPNVRVKNGLGGVREVPTAPKWGPTAPCASSANRLLAPPLPRFCQRMH
jgi:hypothetical protein